MWLRVAGKGAALVLFLSLLGFLTWIAQRGHVVAAPGEAHVSLSPSSPRDASAPALVPREVVLPATKADPHLVRAFDENLARAAPVLGVLKPTSPDAGVEPAAARDDVYLDASKSLGGLVGTQIEWDAKEAKKARSRGKRK